MRRQNNSLAVRREERKGRNLSRTVERNIRQVKWWIYLHNDWVEGTAENVECQVWVSRGGAVGVYRCIYTSLLGVQALTRSNKLLSVSILLVKLSCVYLLCWPLVRGAVCSLLNWPFKGPYQCFCQFLMCIYYCWPFYEIFEFQIFEYIFSAWQATMGFFSFMYDMNIN